MKFYSLDGGEVFHIREGKDIGYFDGGELHRRSYKL